MNNMFLFTDFLGQDYYVSDLINYIEIIKDNNDIMIKRLFDILFKLGFNNEDIASILKDDVSTSLQFIIDVLNGDIS